MKELGGTPTRIAREREVVTGKNGRAFGCKTVQYQPL